MVSAEMPTKDILRSTIRALLTETKTVESCRKAGIDIDTRLQVLPAYKRAEKVSVFISRFPEIDSTFLIDSLFDDSKKVQIPTWLDGDMKMAKMSDKKQFHKLLSTRKSATHIPKPPFDPSAPIEEVDLCVIPGLVFDRFGGRIGYGFGHYDKWLTEHRIKYGKIPYLVAVCHDEQMVDMEIPIEEHDVRVNMVMTPTKTFTVLTLP